MTDLSILLPPLCGLARQAGAAILDVYKGDFEVSRKSDDSPVTEADLRAEAVILDGLRRLTPDIPILSEESSTAPRLVEGGAFWLVDPLDGTKEFVKRNGEFTVNIGLAMDGKPVLGVIYAPVIDRLFSGMPGRATVEDNGRPPRPILCRRPPGGGLVVLTSRSHHDSVRFNGFIRRFTVAEVRPSGSSLKFAMVAAGEADLYPRFGPTMEWDTAAGHALIAAAGGCVTQANGEPLRYGKPGFQNPSVVAWGAPAPFA